MKEIDSNNIKDNEVKLSESNAYTDEEVNNIVQKSTEIMNDLKIYIAILATDSKKQFAQIEKEEYDKLQEQRFVGSEREKRFFENLPDNEIFVDLKTMVVTKDNIGLGFYPPIWKVLSLEQKIALCRLARLNNENKDFTEYVQYDLPGIVLMATGALNINSFSQNNYFGSSFLTAVLNAQNITKELYYLGKKNKNKSNYTKVTSCETFEELRYLYPLEPLDLDNASNRAMAFYYDNIYERKSRRAKQKALDMISADAADLEGMVPEYDEYALNEQKEINRQNLLVLQELGTSKIKRDEEFLKEIVDYFKNVDATEFNKKVSAYNQKLEQMNNTENCFDKYELKLELKKMRNQLEKERPKYVTYEQAKKHYSAYFKQKPQKKLSQKEVNIKKEVSREEYEKMN